MVIDKEKVETVFGIDNITSVVFYYNFFLNKLNRRLDATFINWSHWCFNRIDNLNFVKIKKKTNLCGTCVCLLNHISKNSIASYILFRKIIIRRL